jgi:hypothetical protein
MRPDRRHLRAMRHARHARSPGSGGPRHRYRHVEAHRGRGWPVRLRPGSVVQADQGWRTALRTGEDCGIGYTKAAALRSGFQSAGARSARVVEPSPSDLPRSLAEHNTHAVYSAARSQLVRSHVVGQTPALSGRANGPVTVSWGVGLPAQATGAGDSVVVFELGNRRVDFSA